MLSSNSIIEASFKIVRAIPILCFSPPESFNPLSPTTVLYPLGNELIKSSIQADFAAD